MISAAASVTLPVPAGEAYELVGANPLVWSDLIPMSITFPDGPPQALSEGSSFRQRLGYLGFHDTVIVTVVSNRPERVELVASGNFGADCHIRFSISPVPEEASRLRIEVDVVGPLATPVSALARRYLQRQLSAAAQRLVASCEESRPSVADEC